MTTGIIISAVVFMALGALIHGLLRPGISRRLIVEATDRSTGERCHHVWVRVLERNEPTWMRLTTDEYERAKKRAENNLQDAPN